MTANGGTLSFFLRFRELFKAGRDSLFFYGAMFLRDFYLIPPIHMLQ
ncbi:hypothetical protein Acin_1693 [Acidaminococcus intestini RyC-MR95]|uniref:Uncharacterized protein n=1 Tax=Acidaminococcus intestini (strain RyC-MR95) TaxID=568816 RepID=G4Q3A1_ACIIR|nr:hypothetical protein Acin_1693 [Acidaminococcus intestini RyC-MR95]